MPIELDKDVRDRAIASLQRYFTENLDEPIGNLQAGALLNFFVDEIAPAIYNAAIADAQARLHARVAELTSTATRSRSVTGRSSRTASADAPRRQSFLPASRSSSRSHASLSAIFDSSPRGTGLYQCGSCMPSGR